MIYSVFDWNSGQYHYFEGPGERLGVRPAPRAVINAPNGKGRKLEDMLPEVPAGSRPAGAGTEPRGRIAVLNSQLRIQYGDHSPDRGGYGAVEDDGAVGYGAADVNQAAANDSSPWLVLGLWAGAVWFGYKVANWLGKRVAGV